jgi:DNA-binding transcriptional MerR regulator
MDWKDEKEKVYYKIGEVADILKVGTYVIRYWETEFKFIKPLKLNSSHRLYSKKEIEKLFIVKDLLYDKKFTIKGARNALKSGIYKSISSDADNNCSADISQCLNKTVLKNNSATTNCMPKDCAENPNIGGNDGTNTEEDTRKSQTVYADRNARVNICNDSSERIAEIIKELKIIKNTLFHNKR